MTNSSDNRPLISLCMNARDEADELAKCLQAAAPAADEIVVVDTGSLDNSMQVARSFGARVYQHPWNDDMSEAKNYAVNYAKGKWILWIEPDEVLQPGGAERIRQAAQKPDMAGYELFITNVLDENKTDNFLLTRLFLNHPQIRWVNIIHSQIRGPLLDYAKKHNLKTGICAAHILHYGYLKTNMERKNKVARTLRLFQKQLARWPQDPYSWYQYGKFLKNSDRVKSIEALQNSLRLLSAASSEILTQAIYGAETGAYLVNNYIDSGNIRAARETIGQVEKLGLQITPNFQFMHAVVLQKEGKFTEAIKIFEACLKYQNVFTSASKDWGVDGTLAHFGIGVCYAALKEYAAMEQAYRRSLQLYPRFLPAILNLVKYLLETNRANEAIFLFFPYLEANPEPDTLWENYGSPLLQRAIQQLSPAQRQQIMQEIQIDR